MRNLILFAVTFGSITFAASNRYLLYDTQFRTPMVAHEDGKEDIAKQVVLEQYAATFNERYEESLKEDIRSDFAATVNKVYSVSFRKTLPVVHGVRYPNSTNPIGYYAGSQVTVFIEVDENDQPLVKEKRSREISGREYSLPSDPKEAADVYNKALTSFHEACEKWMASEENRFSNSKTDTFIRSNGCMAAPKPQMYVVKTWERVWKGGRFGAWTPVAFYDTKIKFQTRGGLLAPSYFLKTIFD